MHRYWDYRFFDGGNGFRGMMDFWNNNTGWFMVYDFIRLLIIILVIIYIARLLIKNFTKQNRTQVPDHSNRAIQLLKERYAAGEIDEEEYEKRYQRLKETN